MTGSAVTGSAGRDGLEGSSRWSRGQVEIVSRTGRDSLEDRSRWSRGTDRDGTCLDFVHSLKPDELSQLVAL